MLDFQLRYLLNVSTKDILCNIMHRNNFKSKLKILHINDMILNHFLSTRKNNFVYVLENTNIQIFVYLTQGKTRKWRNEDGAT